ncbi:MAG: hypothetical protein BA866_10525 [Desulfobulbaceae bacterium S5133MH15]|nr:MAG: hypothetical protein BA866_10525 [Desulfobulbaceae bacterium S5133MH15]
MHSIVKYSLSAMIASASMFSVAAVADTQITCKSDNYHHKSCKLAGPGHVRLSKQISKEKCRQGKNWDYDRRNIWVDDGCAAKFSVKYNEKHSSSSDVGKAIGAIAGIAILGALANEADKHDKHKDDNYHGGRHSSYVPGWMIGKFRGYNDQYDADVVMTIKSDGQVSAKTGGSRVSGFINNDELHMGSTVFDITRTSNGFYTNQHGDRSNEVKYHRVN